MTTRVRIATGDYPQTRALIADEIGSDLVELDYTVNSPAHSGFRPFVNELVPDVSELALVTYLIAREMGRPITMLPVVIMRQRALPLLVCPEGSSIHRVDDLVGARIGVRSYTQTTATWIRGVLDDARGLDPAQMVWRTVDPGHVNGFEDPPNAVRLPPGTPLADTLDAGECDALIVAWEARNAPGLRPALDDADAIEAEWRETRGVSPVNHVLCARSDVLTPLLGDELVRMFQAALELAGSSEDGQEAGPTGRGAIDASYGAATEYAFRQGITSRQFSVDELFEP